MPAPTERSGQTGKPFVFMKRTPSDDWADVSSQWSATKCEFSSNERTATATVEFNRTAYIADPSAGEPVIYQDTQFAIVWQEKNQLGGIVLFQGIPATINRKEVGTTKAQQSSGTVSLKHSVTLFADHRDSQIVGAYIPQITDATLDNGDMLEDSTVRCVFNPKGLPNRSVQTETDTGIFGNTYEPANVHYFCTPDGYDHDGNLSTPGRERVRFWTYAQAIAYLLHHYCGTNGEANNGEVTREVTIDFGEQIGNISDGLVWPVVAQLLPLEPPGEEGQSPVTNNFTTDPTKLLTAKVPGIDVTGMNGIEAVGLLLKSAGLGWYIDTNEELPNIDTFPADVTHQFKVWSPGGETNGGIGNVFFPRLEPHFTTMAGRDATSIFGSNNVRDADVRYDYNGLTNYPIVKRAPTRYEVTMQLRPLWKPLHAGTDGTGNAYFDNCTDDEVTDPQYSGAKTQKNVAESEGMLALIVWNGNPEDIQTGQPTSVGRRVQFLARALHSSGKYGEHFYDIGRKWGLPTDWSYPNAEFARDDVSGIPTQWQDYAPVNFEEPGTFIGVPIEGAALWPTRQRPFLPTLSKDRTGKPTPPIVDVSFDSGDTWQRFPSVRVSPTESAIWLLYSNPWADVKNRTLGATYDNMFQAFIHNTFRVRITCSIEGSDDTFVEPPQFTSDELVRAKVFDRSDKYRKEILQSQFVDNVTENPADLADPSDAGTSPDSPTTEGKLLRLFKERDDTSGLTTESNALHTRNAWPRISGNFTIPWIETDARPGMVVPRIDDTQNAATLTGGTAVPRNLDFETTTMGGEKLSPHISGVIYNFRSGEFSTQVVLDDWRSLEGAKNA